MLATAGSFLPRFGPRHTRLHGPLEAREAFNYGRHVPLNRGGSPSRELLLTVSARRMASDSEELSQRLCITASEEQDRSNLSQFVSTKERMTCTFPPRRISHQMEDRQALRNRVASTQRVEVGKRVVALTVGGPMRLEKNGTRVDGAPTAL